MKINIYCPDKNKGSSIRAARLCYNSNSVVIILVSPSLCSQDESEWNESCFPLDKIINRLPLMCSKFQMPYKWSFYDHNLLCSCRKKCAISLYGKFLLHKIWAPYLLQIPSKECLKCVMIGLSCKWSLTFHYTSCLSSLMATALQSYYIRAIYSCLIWLEHV